MTTAVMALGAAGGLGLFLMIWAVAVRPDPDEQPAVPSAALAAAGAVRGAAKQARGWRAAIRRNLDKKTELVQDALMVGRSLEVHALAKAAGLGLGLAEGSVSGCSCRWWG